MKVVFVLFTLISVACNSVDSQTSKLIAPFTGTWKEISKERILGDPKVDEQYQEQFNNPNEFLSENTYSTFLLIKAKGDQLNVSFNVTDQPSIDHCYKVTVTKNLLHFYKKIPNQTDNEYKFQIKDKETLEGEMKSWNGNTYKLTYKKMPKGYKIKKEEMRT